MLVIPLIALFLIKISHLATLSADAQKIMLIVFLAVITPSASTVTQMCQVYGNDAHYASAINVVTTLCAIVTMPFYGAVVFLYLTVYFRFFLQYRIKSYHKRTSTAPITIAFTTSGICPSPNPNSTIKKNTQCDPQCKPYPSKQLLIFDLTKQKLENRIATHFYKTRCTPKNHRQVPPIAQSYVPFSLLLLHS